jgi:uncharacterized membrane protein YhhN
MKILSLLTFVCAVLTIYFDYQDKRYVYFFKPATMIFIIALAQVYGARKGFYRWAIAAGFVCSLVGDIFLINPQNFVFGLAGFLVAHLCYIAAFFKGGKGKFNPLSLSAYP